MSELAYDQRFLRRAERDLTDDATDLRRAADPAPPDTGALCGESTAALDLLLDRVDLLAGRMADTAEALGVTRTYAVLTDEAVAGWFGGRIGGGRP